VTPPADLLLKDPAVEEWVDRKIFRPLGLGVVRLAARTRLSADHLTLACMLLGLVAGHLFFYQSLGLNALGLGLFLVSDVFDSADGQLARLRGTSTRFGAVLDGISDNVRFVNLYGHLLARVLLSGQGPALLWIGLALAAGASQALQASIVDYLKQVFTFVTRGQARLDLPEDLAGEQPATLGQRIALWLYRPYVARQVRWCPNSTRVIREIRRGETSPRTPSEWRRMQAGPIAATALIAQNIRFVLLAVSALPGWPQGFFWLTVAPLNLALLGILLVHERNAGRISDGSVAEADLVHAGSPG
jgi:hypothetical protein